MINVYLSTANEQTPSEWYVTHRNNSELQSNAGFQTKHVIVLKSRCQQFTAPYAL